MKPCLVDVNVWFAILVAHHEHRKNAMAWYNSCPANHAVLCRHVQLALIRLLGNRNVLQEHAVPALTAWNMTQELALDERVQFGAEPPGFETVFPTMLRYPTPTPKLVGDAYLAAFAIAAGLRMVTFDRGWQQFQGLDVTLLR